MVVFIRTPKTGSSSITLSLPNSCVVKAHEPLRYWVGTQLPTFAFIRNPWERMFSWFRHEAYFRRMTFEEYILNMALTEEYVHGNYRTGMKIADQYEWICHEDAYPTMIGRFENLTGDFDAICEVLHIDAIPLGHERINPHREAHPHTSAVWTPEMVAHMDPLFAPFAEQFNYTL
tara:strand:- start:39997 stop:40521 length:525 start_codon:yes stop_codon:yes gene_type:complete